MQQFFYFDPLEQFSIDGFFFIVISNFNSFKTLAIQADLNCVFFTHGNYSWIFNNQQFFSILCLCLFVLFFSFICNNFVEVSIWIIFLLVGGIFWILEVQNSLKLFTLTHEGALLYFLARANRFCYLSWDESLDQWPINRWISVVGFLIYCSYVKTVTVFNLDVTTLAFCFTGLILFLFTFKAFFVKEVAMLACTKEPYLASSLHEKPAKVILLIFLLGYSLGLFFYNKISLLVFICSMCSFALPLAILFGVLFSTKFEVVIVKVLHFCVKKNTFVVTLVSCTLILVQLSDVDVIKLYLSLWVGFNWSLSLLLFYNQSAIEILHSMLCCGDSGKVKFVWETVKLVSKVAVFPSVFWGWSKMNEHNKALDNANRMKQFKTMVNLLDDGLASGSLDETLYKDLMKTAYLGLPSNDRTSMTSTVNVGIFRTTISSQSFPKDLSDEHK